MTPKQCRELANLCERHTFPVLTAAREVELLRAHAVALEEIERLNAAWKAQQFHLEAEERESAHWQERAEQAERRAERLQAQVDALMLEYCPDEMTPEQVEEWTRHQKAVAFDRADKGE